MTSSCTDPQSCPDSALHGNRLRYCPSCTWTEEPAPKVSQPRTIGRIVHYKLSAQDAEYIKALRTGKSIYGNEAREGDVYPAMIVRTFGGLYAEHVNLQVFLDGPDSYWATSRAEGEGVNHWSWPPRV